MSKRRSIHIDPVRHRAPIPMAAVVNGVLKSSGIMGADPATGELAGTAEEQARFVFENVARVMEAAGGDVGDIVHFTVFVKDEAYREAVNEPWLEMFPDPDDRPARHTVPADLRGAMLVQAEVTAIIDN